MVKRTRTDISREINKPLPDHASAHKTSRKERSNSDDLIVSLADAYENKRARQVVEWESSQAINVQRAV